MRGLSRFGVRAAQFELIVLTLVQIGERLFGHFHSRRCRSDESDAKFVGIVAIVVGVANVLVGQVGTATW